MADNIDALLGLVSDPNTDTAALAKQLRGQRDMGNFYSLSTIDQVAGYGKNLRDTALATADKTGTRRTAAEKEAYTRKYQIGRDKHTDFVNDRTNDRLSNDSRLTRAREARQDALAAVEVLRLNTAKKEVTKFRDRETGEVIYVQYDRAGGVFDQSTGDRVDLKGYDEVPPPSSQSNRGERDAYGNKKHLIDGEYWLIGAGPNGENVPYSLDASREIAEDVADADAAAAGGKKFSKETGKLVAQQMPAAIDHRGALRKQRAALGQALGALEGGAWSGTLINKFTPTLRDSTSRLRNAQELLGLGEIGNYVFGSLSTAEGNWLKETSLDLNQKPEQLMSDVRHRIEVVDRMEHVSRYVMRELKKGKYPDQAEIDDILHADGFKLNAPMLGAGGKASAAPAPAPAPPATAAQWANMNEDMRARWLTAGRSAPSVGK